MEQMLKIIQPSGIMDGTKVEEFRKEVKDIITSGTDTILIDLQDVAFVDSSGLGALVSALKIVRSAGGKLYLCSLNEQVKMLFELTSMDRVFQVFDNREQFQASDLS